MAALECLVLLLSFTAISNGASIESRIIGGEVASASEFPWIVSLRANYGRHFCGGTLISPYLVLTAAHCVVSRGPEDVHVVTGSTSLAEGGEYHAVSEIEYHANYSAGSEYSWENDIAIVTLATPAETSDLQSPAAIGTTYIGGNVSAQTSGWGRTIYPGNSLPTALQKLNLTILSNDDCQTYHTLTIHDSQICALSTYGEGVCSGDSGSGLIINGTIVGITSWARLCAMGVPDVYARVSSFTDWIAERTG